MSNENSNLTDDKVAELSEGDRLMLKARSTLMQPKENIHEGKAWDAPGMLAPLFLEEEEDEGAEQEVPLQVKKERVGLENQLFAWDGWDDNGPMMLQFYKVELIVPIGDFPVGHKFPVAFFNGDNSTISFMDEKNVEHTFELVLTVGKKVEKVNDSAA